MNMIMIYFFKSAIIELTLYEFGLLLFLFVMIGITLNQIIDIVDRIITIIKSQQK